MKSEPYINVLAILNAMLTRVSTSLPQIAEATRGLWPEDNQQSRRLDAAKIKA